MFTSGAACAYFEYPFSACVKGSSRWSDQMQKKELVRSSLMPLLSVKVQDLVLFFALKMAGFRT